MELESVAVNANFIGALALYQQRRDTTIGLHHITARQRYLLWYYNTLMMEEQKAIIKASMAKGTMLEIRNQMRQLKRELKQAITIEQKRAILIRATQLEELAEQAING